MRNGRVIFPGIAMVATIYGLSRYTYGLFLPDIKREFNLSIEILGMIASSSYISYMAATLIVPFLIERYGPRLPVIMGGVCATIGMGLISVAHNPLMLATGVVVAGASPGLAYPPVPEAVKRLIPDTQQNKALTVINSGTGFGVLFAGPIALLAGGEWRLAWIGFSIFAILSTVWNGIILPAGNMDATKTKSKDERSYVQMSWFLDTNKRSLFALTFIVGITTSVYWTYAVDLIVSNSDFQLPVGKIFWTIVGVAGILGAFGGHLIERFGFRPIFKLNLLGLSLSLILLPLAPSTWLNIIISAGLFGSIFIMITGLFAIWGVSAFPKNPSMGYTTVFFLITAGQFIGPSLMGWIAGTFDLRTAFFIAVFMNIFTVFVRSDLSTSKNKGGIE